MAKLSNLIWQLDGQIVQSNLAIGWPKLSNPITRLPNYQITRFPLLKRPAPFPAVLRPEDAAHPHAVIFDGAPGVAGDDDVVALFQRIAGHAAQLARGGPLDRSALHLSLVVRSHQVDEGMRVAEHE